MSVPAYKRQENRMTIINRIQDMMKEVIRISKNEKILPRKTERILRQTFVEDAMAVYKCVNAANGLNLGDENERALRRQCQIKAKIKLMDLHSQIKLNIAYLETSYQKYENLIGLMEDVKRLLYAWMKSDKDRKQ